MRKKNGKFIACEICGKLTYFASCEINKNKHFYCSRNCYKKGRKKFNVGENSGNWRGGKINVECSYCRKELKRRKCLKLYYQDFYCSSECRARHASIIRNGKNASNWSGGDIELRCDYCHKKILKQKSLIHKHNFCNTKCRGLFNRKRIKVICYTCNKEFEIQPSQKLIHNFCSKECSYRCVFHGYMIKYNNKFFRSSWEANFAKWCDGSGIKWKYEPKAFELKINGKKTTYTPDFYLPEFDCYIEIKGYWRKDAKEKVNNFIKLFPNNKLEIFEKNKLQELGVI